MDRVLSGSLETWLFTTFLSESGDNFHTGLVHMEIRPDVDVPGYTHTHTRSSLTWGTNTRLEPSSATRFADGQILYHHHKNSLYLVGEIRNIEKSNHGRACVSHLKYPIGTP